MKKTVKPTGVQNFRTLPVMTQVELLWSHGFMSDDSVAQWFMDPKNYQYQY